MANDHMAADKPDIGFDRTKPLLPGRPEGRGLFVVVMGMGIGAGIMQGLCVGGEGAYGQG